MSLGRVEKVVFKVLNIHFDTSTPYVKLMQTMLAVVVEFEREMMFERQAEGSRLAKAPGKFKGRKPTARETSGEVLRLLADGLTKEAVAEKAGIGGSVGVSDCQVGQRIVEKFERLKNRLFHFFVKRELFCNSLCLIE
jgi:DNA invertase Pin-like site-specific DNA recombinase